MKLSDLGRALARFLGNRKREDTMPNIQDYVLWRGDLPLERVPLCDVDALLLSYLSYMPYDHIAGDAFDEGISLRDAAQKLLEVNERDKTPLAYNVREDRKLLAALMESARFRDIRLVGYVNKVDPEQEEQFAAVTYLLGEGRAFVAFRGTDNTVVGWKEDFNMSFVCPVAGQVLAVAYLERAAKQYPDCPITVLGHSKGGNFAVYAAAFCAPTTQARIRAVCNYDGPGFDEKILAADGYKAICGKISTLVPQSSIVGMLLGHEESYTIVHSEQVGILQHDLFSWEARRDSFSHLETVDNSSRFINYTLKKWIADMDYEQRETFTDAIYTILAETHASTLRELSDNWFESAKVIAKSLGNLDEPTHRALTQALSLLAKSAKSGLAQIIESK